MIIETLTGRSFPVDKAAAFALECGARAGTGTDMQVLACCIAKSFGLTVRTTDDVKELVRHLNRGGASSVSEPPAGAGVRAGGFTSPSEYGMDGAPAKLERSELSGDCIAIANVGGDRAGYKGVFSDSGHYVVAFGLAPDGRLMLADPYLYAGKYDKPHRRVVEVVGNWLYAAPGILGRDAQNRCPRYTLFGV